MKTTTERLHDLETEVKNLRFALQAVGAATILPLQQALEQMVDEGQLPATTRAEIWRRIRTETGAISAMSDDLYRAILSSLPYYPKPAQQRSRKEILRPTPSVAAKDRSGD